MPGKTKKRGPGTAPIAQSARRRAWRSGRRAEWWALLWLRLRGYRLLRHGYRCAQGEVDLILRRGGLLAFVEVKRRATLSAAAEAIRPAQQRRIAAAAAHFLQRHERYASFALRYDALLLAPGRLPCHITGAWRDSK
ncbi:YraN family protein [Limibacillus sp. MBR-115]|jgi:putative endonuclease|uniref:YraN family protein n=1 Tax=Limibacillus sp. MBR-115 TaxID=3156465 RepID=UPI003394E0F6